jgi:uncharacterized phiE125 gp8 family phage protein
MGVRVITEPTDEPLTLEEAKSHLQVPAAITDQDATILALIMAARGIVENECRRALITQTLELNLDYFDEQANAYAGLTMPLCARVRPIELPMPPLISLQSVTYINGSGETVTLHDSVGSPQVDDLLVVVPSSKYSPAKVAPVAGTTWPSVASQPGAVTMRYTAGYGDDGSAIPAPIRQAMLLIVGHLFERREAVSEVTSLAELPMGVQYLLGDYIVRTIV